MKETRAAGRKILMAVVCSLLMVLQPVFAARAFARISVAARTAVPVFPSRLEQRRASGSIAVAKLTGKAERNGQPFLDGSIVFSGDSLTTGRDSALLLVPAPEERVWLGPDSSAKLTKSAGNVDVDLKRGTLGFQTRGHMEVRLEQHDGLAIRSSSNSLAVAQLSFTNHQQVQLHLQKGSLELVQGNRTVLLQPEHPRIISVRDARVPMEPNTKTELSPQVKSGNQSNMGSIKGSVVNPKLFVVAGANVTLSDAAGNSFITVTDQKGNFSFDKVPAGTYTLTVTHAGLQSYETRDVVVRRGKESSVYVQMAGVAKKHTGLIIGVVAGGAAAGIGAWAATSKKKSSVSPAVP